VWIAGGFVVDIGGLRVAGGVRKWVIGWVEVGFDWDANEVMGGGCESR
jgi:hypothetical protein